MPIIDDMLNNLFQGFNFIWDLFPRIFVFKMLCLRMDFLQKNNVWSQAVSKLFVAC